MKKLVYTVQGFSEATQARLLEQLLPEVLRAYGGDGVVEANETAGTVGFSVPRSINNTELEQSVNAALAVHGMELVTPPGVRYFAYAGQKSEKARKGIPASVFTAVLIAAVSITLVFTMLITSVVSTIYWSGKVGPTYPGGSSEQVVDTETLTLIDTLIKQYAYEEVDRDAMMEAVIKAYVAATGDVYAEYYTKEEFDALINESQGQMQGIGVSVVNSTLDYNGVTYSVIEIIMVYPGSPAEKAGVRPGDKLITVVHEGTEYSVTQVGYTVAVNYLRGEAGTDAEFTVMRQVGADYQPVDFKVTRAAFEALSVTHKVSATDPSIGIVSILQFDLTTPTQFCAAVDELRTKGCTKFIFDVRNNPGGDLESIKAVLSYFLSEGDVIVSTKDKRDNTEVTKVGVMKHGDKSYAGCDITRKDIGKYKDLKFAVITNGNTASAAELFTATVRDYDLGPIVGETTYGKGCMQSIFSLSYYGFDGGLKLTTKMYFPASGEGYHGIGITPDVPVELSEEAKQYNIYVLPEQLDNQLQTAIDQLK